MSQTQTTDVLVLGLGAFGSATLYQLARRGVRAIGVDRFSPPHDRGSSHGATRITRLGVGEGEAYVPFAQRSHAIWRELEAATGRELLVACGALVLAGSRAAGRHHGHTGFVGRSIDAARRFGIEHQVFDAAAIAERFPQFGLEGSETGYFEPGGGFLRPEACVAAQLEAAIAAGATVRTGETVLSVEADGDGVAVRTDRGRIVAKRAIACLGAWTPKTIGTSLKPLLSVYRQTLYWYRADDPSSFAPDRFPVYIWMHGQRDEDYFYGFPFADEHGGVKVATEQYERTSDPDLPDEQAPTAADAASMFSAHVDGRLRGVRAECTDAVRCWYTVTPDSGFIVDRHPEIEALTLVSACSGHGFKHSAGMGEALAERAIGGATAFDLTPFELARFATAPAVSP